ncbi:hypothetical protein HP439_02885 [Sphingobacterium shayense]|uniref:glycosyl hydrolase n=1 Tax=Sphingobacterium shayense TaxID=626343 RepID=UPI0015524D1B|nr:glycosyl hydrolase [Sphingobacterium shayense]NQD69667.1 hypothetical protein [Sphingobacterium shayense]
MRHLLYFLLIATFQLGLSRAQENSPDDFLAIVKKFENPDKEFRSAPLWVWNTRVDKQSIKFELLELKEKGFGGVFVHPRPGLITPYLSEEWFELYKYTVQQGKSIGLDVWIYDENSYPSGFAGGHVPAEMPSSYNQGQMLHMEVSDVFPATDSAVFVVVQKDNEGKFTQVKSSSQHSDSSFYIFRKQNYEQTPWYGGYSYVDLLAKGVTEKFIEVTMRGYEKHLGDELGSTIPGIFTDEPNIEVQGRGNIRWTPDLFQVFKEKWGYSLAENLPSLYLELGDWKRVRHNYYQTLLQMFIDRWSKPWYAYTEKKGLEWTGHYWEHGWPNPNHGGDNMAMYAWHQRPGIDMLFNQFDESSPNAQFGNIRAVKELSSVANQTGAKRTLSETYGGGGWELTFKDMKRLGDWQYALGVNTLNQHLSFMTIVGARKYDYPPSFSYHSPWWSYYKNLNDYFARLSLTLSLGKQVNDICIIEPTSTTWMYSKFEGDNIVRDSIGRVFQQFVRRLENAQIEYDLGSENIIKDKGGIQADKFQIGHRQYANVILPPKMENLDRPTLALLNKFLDQGGNLVVLSRIKYVDGKENKEDLERINAKFQEPESFKFEQINASPLITQTDSNPVSLYHHRRELATGEILFLTNTSLDDPISLRVPVEFKHVYKMDLFTGTVKKVSDFDGTGGKNLSLSLAPVESSMYFLSNEKYSFPTSDGSPKAHDGKVINTATEVVYYQPNVLTVDFCDLIIDGQKQVSKYVFEANDTLFKYFGFEDGNPWNTSVQFKDETVRRDTFAKDKSLQIDYHIQVSADFTADDLQIAIERDSLWEIYFNDKPIDRDAQGWFIDKDIKTYKIPNVRPGANTLSLRRKGMSIYAEIEPVYVLGDFATQPTSDGWRITKAIAPALGSWKENGRPMYGFSAGYVKKLDVQPSKKYLLQLQEWKGTAAVVKVNGRLVGDISYPPFQLELSELTPGENEIEVIVVGALKNTLGPFHNNPAPGMVSPWHFRNISGKKSGESYQTHDFGLLQDFKLLELSE